jgi:large subunit ribosomal protein L13
MDMNKAFFLKKEDRQPNWVVLDAKGMIVGRLATKIADILHGKHVPAFTPHDDAGDYVIVINAKDVVLSGNKWSQKTYDRYSGYIGGLKTSTAKDLGPIGVIEKAVERMLPKSKMGRAAIKKLRIYEGAEHPHQGQVAAK